MNSPPPSSPPGRRFSPDLLAAATLAVVLLIVGALRWRLLGMPLERDEGEFAYAGQLLLQGVAPYTHAYAMKLPGMYVLCALFLAAFGQTAFALHLGLLLANTAATILVFLIGRHLIGRLAAVAAGTVYAFVSASPDVLGMAAHATQFVVAFALGGLYLLVRAFLPRAGGSTRITPVSSSRVAFVAGLLLGLATLLKQSGSAFTLFGGCILLGAPLTPTRAEWRGKGRALVALTAGALLPLAATWLWLYAAGVQERAWFWTVEYAREYARINPIGSLPTLLEEATRDWNTAYRDMYLFSLAGLVALLRDRRHRQQGILLAVFFLVSAASVVPGLWFRPHYFVQLLPAAALAHGALVQCIAELGQPGRRFASRALALRATAIVLLVGPLGLLLYSNREYHFADDPATASRRIYRSGRFCETVAVAEYLRQHSSPQDSIAIIGSEPQICFLSGRRSATGYLYLFSLIEPQPFARRMQEEFVAEVERGQPRYLVVATSPGSEAEMEAYAPQVWKWQNDYLRHFERVAVAVSWPQDPSPLRVRLLTDLPPDQRSPGPFRSYLTLYKRTTREPDER